MHTDPDRHDVIIIGAGASGLFCAAACGRRGRSVLVLDHGQRTGAKVRISGGGRCNFTNLHVTPDHYRSSNAHFCRSALARFTPQDMLALCRKHGIRYAEKEQGQMFCLGSSREIVGLLEKECQQPGIEVRLECPVLQVRKDSSLFTVETAHSVLRASSLVIATGGLSYPNLGASGLGFDIARQFGLSVKEPRPGLVPFVLSGRERKFLGPLSGVSLPCAVRCNSKRHEGSLLFTHKGLSGPAMLQASLSWEPGMALVIDLLPYTDVLGALTKRRHSKVELRNFLAEHLPKRFSQVWCEHQAISRPLNQIGDRELREIAAGLHAWEIVPAGTEGYATAEVTAGGVDTSELSSKTMEAKKVSGLFFIGEVVDVTGELGGFNLHWAWASASAAGEYA